MKEAMSQVDDKDLDRHDRDHPVHGRRPSAPIRRDPTARAAADRERLGVAVRIEGETQRVDASERPADDEPDGRHGLPGMRSKSATQVSNKGRKGKKGAAAVRRRRGCGGFPAPCPGIPGGTGGAGGFELTECRPSCRRDIEKTARPVQGSACPSSSVRPRAQLTPGAVGRFLAPVGRRWQTPASAPERDHRRGTRRPSPRR